MQDEFYKELVNAFFSEQQQASLRNLRNTDAEYNNWRATHAETGREYEAILNDLPPNDVAVVEKYNADTNRINGRERDCVYLQGYRDCVKFLRLIELIA